MRRKLSDWCACAVNPQEYFGEIEKTLGLIFRDQTHAIGRNIHQSDPVARLWHIGGVIAHWQ